MHSCYKEACIQRSVMKRNIGLLFVHMGSYHQDHTVQLPLLQKQNSSHSLQPPESESERGRILTFMLKKEQSQHKNASADPDVVITRYSHFHLLVALENGSALKGMQRLHF